MEQKMAAMFLAKRGTIKTSSISSILKNYNNNTVRSVTVASENNEKDKSKQEGMGITTDGKAPNVTLSHAADTAKDELERAVDAATEKHGDASKPKKNEGDEENVAVGDNGTVKGENQSGG